MFPPTVWHDGCISVRKEGMLLAIELCEENKSTKHIAFPLSLKTRNEKIKDSHPKR